MEHRRGIDFECQTWKVIRGWNITLWLIHWDRNGPIRHSTHVCSLLHFCSLEARRVSINKCFCYQQQKWKLMMNLGGKQKGLHKKSKYSATARTQYFQKSSFWEWHEKHKSTSRHEYCVNIVACARINFWIKEVSSASFLCCLCVEIWNVYSKGYDSRIVYYWWKNERQKPEIVG